MERSLWLLWSPQGWGVFDMGTCPDPGAFPKYWYRRYDFEVSSPFEDTHHFATLNEFRKQYAAEGIIPTRENYDELFPDISDILTEGK